MSIKVKAGSSRVVELNTLVLHHRGLDWKYARDVSGPVVQLSVEKEEPVTMVFNDTYEIDMLIAALAQFKEECNLNSGKLTLAQARYNPSSQEVGY